MSRRSLILLILCAATVAGCSAPPAPPSPLIARLLVAEAREAGMVAIASAGSTSVRVLYARNGGMVFLRDVRLPAGDRITDVALSADGKDLVVDTNRSAYTISTRTWSSHPVRVVAIQRPPTTEETLL